MSATIAPTFPPAPPPPTRSRLKRLRLALIVLAILLLGLVSFVFGIFISVTSELPSLSHFSLFKDAKSSVLLDDHGRQIGVLSQHNRVIVTPNQIPAIVKQAVISIEDKRFYTNGGIDLRGIVRALVADIRHRGGVQGASTIEQQFIKTALQAQSHRTILEKLREAALAFQLSHKWSKDKIITAYLNTIYFGSGAYGVEAAAETYFGQDVNHQGCGTPGHQLCVEQLQPWEAALLAGIIQSPSAYDPAAHPIAARERRDRVLHDMLEQGYLTRALYDQSVREALPSKQQVTAPHEQSVEGVDVGYFNSWVGQQVIEHYGAARAFDGGLRVRTTLDLEMQRAAEQAINNYLAYTGGPTASLVAIENSTGKVRAMVGGRSYHESPFNLATQGERQPGSAFKAFDLAAALTAGVSPESVWSSKQKVFYVHSARGLEKFVVHNDEGSYTGSNTLTGATAYSDNSIFAEVGLKVGTKRIAQLAHEMGITTPLSTNPAMTIGGLTVGVTPLDMAHAYSTLAHNGERVSGSLVEEGDPVGIQEVEAGPKPLPDGAQRDIDHVRTKRVLSSATAHTETSMLESVLQYGTGHAAAIGQFAAGKTGTTSNFGDAWFVGWDSRYTVAVWVGYPNKLVPMTTEFNGQPVMGGTFPALIWHDFMTAALQIDANRAEQSGKNKEGASTTTTPAPEASAKGTSSTSGANQPNPSKGGPAKAGGEANGAPQGNATSTPTPSQGAATPSTPAAPPVPAREAPNKEAPPANPATPSPSTGGGSPTGGVAPSG